MKRDLASMQQMSESSMMRTNGSYLAAGEGRMTTGGALASQGAISHDDDKMPRRPSIHDVAREAKCSIATVSLVINGTGRIGDETRKKVMDVIGRLGYQPNTAGRNLRLQRSDTIGLMFHPSPSKIFKNVFYIEMMEGLEETFYQNGLSVLLGSGREELAAGNLPKFMRTGAVDALILMGYFPSSQLELLIQTRTPVFLLDSFDPLLAVECLTSDGYAGASMAMEHLVSLGHKRIAMLAYDMPEYNIATRISGFEAAVRRLGLKKADCPTVNHFKFNHELPDIFAEMMLAPNAPTAFICVNDTLAVYVIQHFQNSGYEIPAQVSVVGFDDDTIARDHRPALTTVRLESRSMGEKGAEMVMDRLRSPDMSLRKVLLPVSLVVRDSTGPVFNKS